MNASRDSVLIKTLKDGFLVHYRVLKFSDKISQKAVVVQGMNTQAFGIGFWPCLSAWCCVLRHMTPVWWLYYVPVCCQGQVHQSIFRVWIREDVFRL